MPGYIGNYGKRTGVTTIRAAVKLGCRIYSAYRPSIIAWVKAHAGGEPTESRVIAWLDGISFVCDLFGEWPDD